MTTDPLRPRRTRGIGWQLKRAMDIVVAATALLILSPLLAAVAIAIRWSMGSPIFFRQVRPGLRAEPFEVVKFRTMQVGGDPNDSWLQDEQRRITRLGQFLRRLSLDELPQLWNVLRGEMSLVGPRPLLMEYLPVYTQEQARRHEVRPGITGWAQVNGRRSIRMKARLELDVWYVDRWSLWVDLQIIALTVRRVIAGHGVEPEAGGDVDPFQDAVSAVRAMKRQGP